MIPVALYGVNVELCEAFYEALPTLVADSVDDENYAKALFSIETEASLEHIRIADQWSNHRDLHKYNEDRLHGVSSCQAQLLFA